MRIEHSNVDSTTRYPISDVNAHMGKLSYNSSLCSQGKSYWALGIFSSIWDKAMTLLKWLFPCFFSKNIPVNDECKEMEEVTITSSTEKTDERKEIKKTKKKPLRL